MIGGIAVIARGVPRVTRDIDITFSGADIALQALAAELAAAGIVARIEDAPNDSIPVITIGRGTPSLRPTTSSVSPTRTTPRATRPVTTVPIPVMV